MSDRKEKPHRLQIPVSKEFASRVTELGKCLRLSQSAMAAALLEEGIGTAGKWEQWFEKQMANALNIARGRGKVRADGDPTVYLQTFVDDDVKEWLTRLAGGLKNTEVRVAAMLLESAVHDNGWVIDVFGTAPGRAVGKLLKSMKTTSAPKATAAERSR